MEHIRYNSIRYISNIVVYIAGFEYYPNMETST